jgi:hypothetical protein
MISNQLCATLCSHVLRVPSQTAAAKAGRLMGARPVRECTGAIESFRSATEQIA